MVDQWDPSVCACRVQGPGAAWKASHWRCISCGVALLSGIIMSFVCRFFSFPSWVCGEPVLGQAVPFCFEPRCCFYVYSRYCVCRLCDACVDIVDDIPAAVG